MKKTLLSAACLLLAFSLRAQSEQLKKLGRFMAGTYSSEKQHKTDTVNYFDIKLQIIPIWKDRKNGLWFYVEQAVAGSESKPYRQRVYHLTEKDQGVFESAVFIFSSPLRFTNNAQLFESSLTPDSLTLREGCSVFLKPAGKLKFIGGTEGTSCASERKGAVYASAEVEITEKELRSWDRGFNKEGEQVWGAEKGGYIFIKK